MNTVDKAVRISVTDSSGDWIPPDLLQDSALAAWRMGMDVTVSLESVEYLDATALQILIALATALERDLHKLELVNLSTALVRWFCLAGATSLLPPAIAVLTHAEAC